MINSAKMINERHLRSRERTIWSLMFSNKQLRTTRHFKNCSLNNFFRQVPPPLRTRGIARSRGGDSSIELSRTMVLVTKATRCHRPWISVVAEGWQRSWRKGWRALETRSGETLAGCTDALYRNTWYVGPSLLRCLKIYYIPSNTS